MYVAKAKAILDKLVITPIIIQLGRPSSFSLISLMSSLRVWISDLIQALSAFNWDISSPCLAVSFPVKFYRIRNGILGIS